MKVNKRKFNICWNKVSNGRKIKMKREILELFPDIEKAFYYLLYSIFDILEYQKSKNYIVKNAIYIMVNR